MQAPCLAVFTRRESQPTATTPMTDFQSLFSNVWTHLERGEYDESATLCRRLCEMGLRHLIETNMPRLARKHRAAVDRATDEIVGPDKTLSQASLAQLVGVLNASQFWRLVHELDHRETSHLARIDFSLATKVANPSVHGTHTADPASIRRFVEDTRIILTYQGLLDQRITTGSARSAPLLGISHCLQDMIGVVSRANAAEELRLRHLGLDMSIASDYVATLLRSCPARALDFKILIMSEEGPEPAASAPKEVKAWSTYVPGSILRIRNHVEHFDRVHRKNYQSVRVEIRAYRDIPRFHGVMIDAPTRICYASACRYAPPDYETYDWGEFAYHRIDRLRDPPGEQDFATLLEANFERLWMHNAQALWAFDRPAAAEASGGLGASPE